MAIACAGVSLDYVPPCVHAIARHKRLYALQGSDTHLVGEHNLHEAQRSDINVCCADRASLRTMAGYLPLEGSLRLHPGHPRSQDLLDS